MCIIEDLCIVAACQEHAIPGYVEDTSDAAVAADILADYVEASLDCEPESMSKVELKQKFPLFGEVIQDDEGDWLVISASSQMLTEPTVVRARKLSDENPHNKSNLAKPYQIRMFKVADLRPMQGDRANWIKVDEPIILPPNEPELGSYDHITAPVDVEITIPVRQPEPEFDTPKKLASQPIMGPIIYAPLSTNLLYHYYWIDGQEIRVLKTDKTGIAKMVALGHRR
jgi:hypothetical protein